MKRLFKYLIFGCFVLANIGIVSAATRSVSSSQRTLDKAKSIMNELIEFTNRGGIITGPNGNGSYPLDRTHVYTTDIPDCLLDKHTLLTRDYQWNYGPYVLYLDKVGHAFYVCSFKNFAFYGYTNRTIEMGLKKLNTPRQLITTLKKPLLLVLDEKVKAFIESEQPDWTPSNKLTFNN